MTEKDDGNRKRSDWRSQLTSFLLGSASGMATNLVSGATAYRAIAASVILAAAFAASARLRALPRRAPLVRYAIRFLLALGLVATMLAVAGPPDLAPYMIFGAVGLIGAAVLVPTEAIIRANMIGGTVTFGLGVAVVAYGVVGPIDREFLVSAAAVSIGMAVTSYGIVNVVERNPLAGIELVCIGIATLGYGCVVLTDLGFPGTVVIVSLGSTIIVAAFGYLTDREIWFCSAGICFGLVFVGNGIALLVTQEVTRGIMVIGAGVASIAICVAYIYSDLLASATAVCIGVIAVGVGVALLVAREVDSGIVASTFGAGLITGGVILLPRYRLLHAVMLLGAGVTSIAIGIIVLLVDQALLFGTAFLCIGVGAISFGIAALPNIDKVNQTKSWIVSLSKDPGDRASPSLLKDVGGTGENSGRRSTGEVLPVPEQANEYQGSNQRR